MVESRAMRATRVFDEDSEDYKCCCGCCTLRSATLLVGLVELFIISYFLVVTIYTAAEQSVQLDEGNPEILGPFAASLSLLLFSIVIIILLFMGIIKKSPGLLMPHFILQVISLVLFLFLIVSASLALNYNTTYFYRILSIIPFESSPDNNTVSLNGTKLAAVWFALFLYCLAFLLQIWFCVIVWRCYRYLQERQAYVRYCHSYSMPMKGVQQRTALRVPQYNYSPRRQFDH